MSSELFVTCNRCATCGVDRLIPARQIDGRTMEKLAKEEFLYPFKARLTQPRNPKVHNLFFAACDAAAKQWPEGEEPYPEGDGDMLRGWLLCKAGHCVRLDDFKPEQIASIITLIQSLRAEDKYAYVKPYQKKDGSDWLAVFIPKSISYEAADEADFAPVKTDCIERMENTLGVDIKTLVAGDAASA